MIKYVAAIGFLALVVTTAHLVRMSSRPPEIAHQPARDSVPVEQASARLERLSDQVEQVSTRLSQLSARLDVSTSPPPVYPSAAAIAAELVRQVPKEVIPANRPSFTLEHKASSIADGRLQFAVFLLTRRGDPAPGISLKSPPGINGWFEPLQSTADCDRYQVFFQPRTGSLPQSWTFSIAYLGGDQKQVERTFEAIYGPNESSARRVRVAEKPG